MGKPDQRTLDDLAMASGMTLKVARENKSETGNVTRLYSLETADKRMAFLVSRRDHFGQVRFFRTYPHTEEGQEQASGNYWDECKR